MAPDQDSVTAAHPIECRFCRASRTTAHAMGAHLAISHGYSPQVAMRIAEQQAAGPRSVEEAEVALFEETYGRPDGDGS